MCDMHLELSCFLRIEWCVRVKEKENVDVAKRNYSMNLGIIYLEN